MISVCMATYNGAKYIKDQVDSILPQLADQDELIVSDDGSSDDTLNILRAYEDDRIKIFANDNKKGVIGNFENALVKAKGDYIFLSDQDDVWLPGKVEKCIAELRSSDLVLHNARLWSGYQIIHPSFFELRGTKQGYLKNLVKNSYIGCCMAFNAEIRNAVLAFPEGIAMHDMYIGLIAERSRNFKISFIPEPLILYRRHGDNASPTGEKSTLSRQYQLAYRLRMFLLTVLKV